MIDYFDFSDPFYDNEDSFGEMFIDCDACNSAMAIETNDNHDTTYNCSCGFGYTIPFQFSIWGLDEEFAFHFWDELNRK